MYGIQYYQILNNNWRLCNFKGAAIIDADLSLHIQPFAMDESRIVGYDSTKEEFYVISRWTRIFEKVMQN